MDEHGIPLPSCFLLSLPLKQVFAFLYVALGVLHAWLDLGFLRLLAFSLSCFGKQVFTLLYVALGGSVTVG